MLSRVPESARSRAVAKDSREVRANTKAGALPEAHWWSLAGSGSGTAPLSLELRPPSGAGVSRPGLPGTVAIRMRSPPTSCALGIPKDDPVTKLKITPTANGPTSSTDRSGSWMPRAPNTTFPTSSRSLCAAAAPRTQSPLCDSTHERTGFQAADRGCTPPPEGAETRPAATPALPTHRSAPDAVGEATAVTKPLGLECCHARRVGGAYSKREG